VRVPEPGEYVARGAAVQAAAALTGRDVGALAADWAPAVEQVVEPDPTIDAASVRGAYREACATLMA
jgi:xylulokinase